MAKNKRYKQLIALILALLINLQIFYTSYYYIPTKKRNNKPNLFNVNNFAITEEEADTISSELYEKLHFIYNEEDRDLYQDEYLVLNAISQNEDFSHNLVDITHIIYEILKDNPDLEKEKVYNALLNVSIAYKRRPFYIKDNVSGVYHENFNSIGIFVNDKELNVLYHEIIHCLFHNENSKNLPTYFIEGMAELLTNEYTAQNPFVENESYCFEIAAVKMLCEITSPEIVLETYKTGNMNLIIKEIVNLGISEDRAITALNLIDEALTCYRKDKELKTNIHSFYTDCLMVFEECIEIKSKNKNYNISSYFYNENLFYNCLFKDGAKERYIVDIERYGVDYKAYFSSALKEKVANGSYLEAENNIQKSALILSK